MHTIIHIGAGSGERLDDYLEAGAERIVLIEPQTELAQILENKTSSYPNVHVLSCAISQDKTRSKLFRFNLSQFDSLYKATGLKTLYPGVRERDPQTVKTLTLKQLVEKHPVSDQQENLLVIEAPGSERDIVQGLVDHELIGAFTSIKLVCPKVALFEGDSRMPKVRSLLEAAGYALKDYCVDDPDWPVAEFELSAVYLEAISLRQQLAVTHKELEDTKRWLQESQSLLNHQKEQAQENEKSKLSEIIQQLSVSQKENDSLKQELSEQQQQSQQASEQAQRERAQLKEQLGTVQKENDRLQAENAELKQRQALFMEEMNKAEAQLEQLKELILENETADISVKAKRKKKKQEKID